MKKTMMVAAGMALLGFTVYADDSAPTTTVGDSLQSPAASGSGRFGAGVMVGEPTGASLKYFFSDTFAVDGGIGWAFHNETDFHLHSDALWHLNDLFDTNNGQFSLYFGVGARVKFREDAEDRIGLRIPMGVSYKFDRAPVDIFVEAAPIIDFTPSTDGSFSAAIGVRYWF